MQSTIQTTIGEINQLHREAREAHFWLIGTVKLRFPKGAGPQFPKPEILLDPKKIPQKDAIRKARDLGKTISRLQAIARLAGKNAVRVEEGIPKMDPKDCPEEAINTARFAWGRIAEISIETREILRQLVNIQHLLEAYGRTGITRLPLKPDYR